MMRARLAVLCGAAGLSLLCSQPVSAATGNIHNFSTLSSGNVSFTVTSLASSALLGSQVYAYTLQVTTSALPGSVTLTAPAISGTSGNAIPAGAFLGSCAATSDPSGIFSSSGLVRLGAGAVKCATITANTNNKTVQFSVSLFLDCTDDATAFAGDTYANGTLQVTANAP